MNAAVRERAFIVAGRLARYSGGGAVSRVLTAPDNVRIVLSHYIPEDDLRHYGEIVRYLTRERRVITPQELFSYYDPTGEHTPIRGRQVLFSFDDGLLSSYHAAKHVLGPLGIKAIFFVPTAILELETEEEMRRFAWERIHHCRRPIESLRPEKYLTMSRRELLELHRDGNAVFPHTHSHMNISEIRKPEDVETELLRPKLILEDLLQTSCDAFAFPVGNERVINYFSFQQVAQIYSYCFWALTGANTAETHPLLLHRDSIHPWYSLGHVRTVVGGSYDAYHALRQRRVMRRIDLPTRRPALSGISEASAGTAEASSERRRFIESVGQALEEAGVDYVCLHGFEPRHERDSDIDIAVSRESLDVLDALIRSGVFGRLLQRLDYAAPWSRYYVVGRGEPHRRYRELDVVCDPRGIGDDGPAPQVALANAVTEGEVRVPAPAAQTLYLAIKRARKRQAGDRAREQLVDAYARDPRGARALLELHLGRPGRDLARALETRQESIGEELEAVRKKHRDRWRSPPLAARRLLFGGWRVARRIVRASGLVVSITGPDGVGKSTLVAGLARSGKGPFRRFRRFHLGPGLLPPPARLLRRAPATGESPHGRRPSGLGGSVLRVLYMWVNQALSWPSKVRVPEIRSALVVIERGWLDLEVDPYRYRLSSPPWLTKLLAKLLPRPSVVLRLDAPTRVLAARKAELEKAETDRQLAAWRQLAAKDPARFSRIDAARSPEDVLAQALDAIDERLAARQKDLRSCELALACLGDLQVGGTPYRIISAPRGPLGPGPRWLLPNRRGAPGPRRAGLYRPAHARHHAPALALDLAQELGLQPLGTRVTIATERGAGPAIAEALALKEVELGAAVTGDPGRGWRALLSVAHEGEIAAFAKVARDDASKLERERRVLDLLASCDLEALVVPKALALLEWRDCKILLLEPFRARRRADRRLGKAELAGLVELAGLSRTLAPALGRRANHIPVHGDFTPWNSAPANGARLMLWDWEEARLGLPLEDLFYWRMQRLLRLRRGTLTDLVAAALEPANDVTTLCEHLSISPASAPSALRMCLEHTLDERRRMAHVGPQWAGAVPILEKALAELSDAMPDGAGSTEVDTEVAR